MISLLPIARSHVVGAGLLAFCCILGVTPAVQADGPYERDAHSYVRQLSSRTAAERAAAAEALSFMRAYGAADTVAERIDDPDAEVRREAAMNLGWTGSRAHLAPLLEALDDPDWTVRQAAAVSLENLTALRRPFDAMAPTRERAAQAAGWKKAIEGVLPENTPEHIERALTDLPRDARPEWGENLALNCNAFEAQRPEERIDYLTDGRPREPRVKLEVAAEPRIWVVDLGSSRPVGAVRLFSRMTGRRWTDSDVDIWIGEEPGKQGTQVVEGGEAERSESTFRFEPVQGRYVTIEYGRAVYREAAHAFLREIEVYASAPEWPEPGELAWQDVERAFRAAGALDCQELDAHIVGMLVPYMDPADTVESRDVQLCVQAGIQALGRLATEASQEALLHLLRHRQWAPYAAEALGDIGGQAVAAALLEEYRNRAFEPAYYLTWHQDTRTRGLSERFFPADSPRYTARDRIPYAAHAILVSLSRMEFKDDDRRALREIAPYIVATMPNDFDGTIMYSREPWQEASAWLLEQAGMRQAIVDAAFVALGVERPIPDGLPPVIMKLARHTPRAANSPDAGQIIAALCRSEDDVPDLIELLDHKNGYIRINAAKALMFMGAESAAPELARRLRELPDDAEYGFTGRFDADEFEDPSPRFKEAFVRALGRLGGAQHEDLLVEHLFNERNTLEVQYAAALALDDLGIGMAALTRAAGRHPYHSVRLVAREALAQRDMDWSTRPEPQIAPVEPQQVPQGDPEAVVFIKGPHNPPNDFSSPATLASFFITDGGPAYRVGHNIYRLEPVGPDGEVTQLTHFEEGYVADLEVSYDGRRVLFCRRAGDDDPWWHVYEMNADGSNLRKLTQGRYHHVGPNYMPDGRIVMHSSRIGMRDEYHGYLSTGLTVMNADGSDVHCIGFNLGRDTDPVIAHDGRILFTRLELFYSRMKNEVNLETCFPDGTNLRTLYGPERRDFWTSMDYVWSRSQVRHRALHMSQPQSLGFDRFIINSFEGPVVVSGPHQQRIIQQDNTMAITTPYPLGDGRLLVAAGKRPFKKDRKTGEIRKDKQGNPVLHLHHWVDHGLHYMDTETGELELIYNDPETSEFEARPLRPRHVPPVLAGSPTARSGAYTGRVYCRSVFNTRHPAVRDRGRYVRIVEGLPTIARHQTQRGQLYWKNHGGATGRVWATVPLAGDGSFSLEVPADRLFHFQVLDSNRRVVGNELIWQYVRPGENKGCVGCHEPAFTADPPAQVFPKATERSPIEALPTGGEIRYRAKMWFKGHAPWEREERMRTVNSVNIIGRQ